jgi:hypothetical protein
MRPLLKLMPRNAPPGGNIQSLLFQATGAYCHLCESRLSDYSQVTDKQTGSAMNAATAAQWPALLLLCEGCFRAQQKTMQEAPEAVSPLYPDEQRSFSLDKGTSPFTYEKRMVAHYSTDEQGTTLSEAVQEEMVLVKGATAEAQATINKYKLNSPYYDAKNNAFRVTLDGPGIDIRVYQRTQMWGLISDFVDRYKKLLAIEPALAHLMLKQGKILAASSGFWSIWATLLWEGTADRKVLSAILLPKAENVATARSEAQAAGGEDAFSGTDTRVFD